MSRLASIQSNGGRQRGALDKWNGESHEIYFTVKFKTEDLVTKQKTKNSFTPQYSFDTLELEHCLIEKVECELVAPSNSVVFMFPTFVDIIVGGKKLTPVCKNCPGNESMVDSRPRVVYRGNIDPDTLKACRNFGNFTTEKLSSHHGVVQRGVMVELPGHFEPMIREHYEELDQTETISNVLTLTRDEFENHLQPSLLRAIKPVQEHFHDASNIDVYVKLDPSSVNMIDKYVKENPLVLQSDVHLKILMRIMCQRKIA